MKHNLNIIELPSYLSHEQCDFMRTQFKGVPLSTDDFWDGRTTWTSELDWRKDICDDLMNLCIIIKNFYAKDVRLTSPHTVIWPEGHQGMPPHQDYGIHSEFPHREYAALVALNDDYEGGGTYFPHIGTTYNQKKGDLLLFHGGPLFHGVNPIKKNDRHTMLMWFVLIDKFAEDIEPITHNFIDTYNGN